MTKSSLWKYSEIFVGLFCYKTSSRWQHSKTFYGEQFLCTSRRITCDLIFFRKVKVDAGNSRQKGTRGMAFSSPSCAMQMVVDVQYVRDD